MSGDEWAKIISSGVAGGLAVYSTVTQKPIRTPAQGSLLGTITGTDYGPYGTPSASAPLGASTSILLLGGLAVVALFLLKK